ncbi:MAG: hypothetical protein DWQ07_15555 [Chloroflexi bacterium]|nr:MAG: hypothetical protein DWQ07_15555 [Chloroflexota bacterium]MBL1197249.1 hypothetical protein [Chloroflexota bacterium]
MNKFWEANFFFQNMFIPLAVLALYFFTLAQLLSSSLFQPIGINYVFASRSWPYVLGLVLVIFLVFFVVNRIRGGERLVFKRSTEKLSAGDLLLLLLPITPIIQYVINNQDILSPLDSLGVVTFFVLFSGIYVFGMPALLSWLGSVKVLRTLGLAFVYTVTSMVSLAHSFAWLGEGNLVMQWMFFGGAFLVVGILYSLSNKNILRFIIVVNFVAVTSTQLFAGNEGAERVSDAGKESRLLALVEERPATTPNIYLLVYDAYIPNETMLAYGIDNNAQEEYLDGLGFVLYPRTYTVTPFSIGSMSSVLNASTDDFGNIRSGVSGDGIIHHALQGIGYETYGVFAHNHFFRGINSSYDFSYPGRSPISANILVGGILVGEFRFDDEFAFQPREEFLETKRSILESVPENQVFMYAHSNIPGHSQNSGACRPDETNLFKERLVDANLEMREDLEFTIANDPEAIIIVAGDHGPFLTKNCIDTGESYDISDISRLDIQDRYGSFLAIRWPTGNFEDYDDIKILQDLFPAIFAYLYNDPAFLELRVEPATNNTYYTSGVSVENGIIQGGSDDGEPLYEIGQ